MQQPAPRPANWRALFSAAIEARRNTPLAWGASDCCLSAADLARSYCGVDHAAPLRGYSTPEGAVRALRRLGFASVAEYLDSILPRAARPREGDVVLIPSPPLDVLMISAGGGMAWGQDDLGLARVAIPAHALFWSV